MVKHTQTIRRLWVKSVEDKDNTEVYLEPNLFSR